MTDFPFSEYSYNGPVFDAHAHVIDFEALKLYVEIGKQHSIIGSVIIVHGDDITQYEDAFPNRFVFAKYFSGWTLFTDGPVQSIKEVKTLRDEGYGLVKMHFAPFWNDRLSDVENVPAVDDDVFDILFDALKDEDIPVLIHIGDPDTYFASRYSDSKQYGTKEEHIQEFENRLKKHTKPIFQVAHFLAQPEPHRIDNLARMFDTYPNLNVDTSSARWMARELGKDPEKSRKFILKYYDRILFGTDCVARTMDRAYYEGRHSTQRLMWESSVEKAPLPFIDKDTVNTGGTFIYGLDLPENILEKMYWSNAQKLYNLEDP
ncbi:MAG: amidohydrolase family protein [Candidatus Thorarchaeota archaeon]